MKIKYQGFGGISVPRAGVVLNPEGINYLDYGGDADLWVSTGQGYPNSWTQVELFPDEQNPAPFYYFEYLNYYFALILILLDY